MFESLLSILPFRALDSGDSDLVNTVLRSMAVTLHCGSVLRLAS